MFISAEKKETPVWEEYQNFGILKGEFLLNGITKAQCIELYEAVKVVQ